MLEADLARSTIVVRVLKKRTEQISQTKEGLIKLKNELEPAAQFIDILRQASQQSYSEKPSGQLIAIAVKHPDALPLIGKRLLEMKSEPDFPAMADFLCASGIAHDPMYSQYFSAVIDDASTGFSRALDSADQYLQAGLESRCVFALIRAMNLAISIYDQWVVMRRSVFYFNRIGQYRRAQACALVAFQIAQQLEDESLIQRSRFSVLNSTRLKGGVDMSAPYAKQFKSFSQHALYYSELNQCLIPIYAALHLMDLGQDDKMIRTLLGASSECIPDEYSRLNSKLAWARYNYLCGRTQQARYQFQDLTENLTFSIIDAPVVNQLRSLSREFGVGIKPLKLQAITIAPKSLWHRFDLALDYFCVSVKESC